MQHGVSLAECSALAILARHADRVAVDQQRCERGRLGAGPIERSCCLRAISRRRAIGRLSFLLAENFVGNRVSESSSPDNFSMS